MTRVLHKMISKRLFVSWPGSIILTWILTTLVQRISFRKSMKPMRYWVTLRNVKSMMSTENIGSMLMNSKHRNERSNRPEALVVRAALADSVAEDKVFPMVTEHIGIAPMEKAFPEVTPVASLTSSSRCSATGEARDKVLRDSVDRTLMRSFICRFVMLLRRINRYWPSTVNRYVSLFLPV